MIDCKLLELLYVHYKFVKKVRQRSWIISWFQQSERPKNAKNKCQSHVVLPPCPQHGGGAPFCVTQLMLYTGDKLSSPIFCCLSVCQVSVTPDQISTFSNIYRHTSPLLTMYHLIPSSTNLYWPSTSQYRYILTQYHQVPPIIYHLVRQSSANWMISLFRTYLMSHAQYTWSSSLFKSIKVGMGGTHQLRTFSKKNVFFSCGFPRELIIVFEQNLGPVDEMSSGF